MDTYREGVFGETMRDLVILAIGLAFGIAIGYVLALWEVWSDRKADEGDG